MEESLLFELLYKGYLANYHEQLKNGQDGEIFEMLKKSRKNLENNLSAEDLKLVDDYKFHYDLCEDDINFQTGIKILNCGIKIGMQLQKSLCDEEL